MSRQDDEFKTMFEQRFGPRDTNVMSGAIWDSLYRDHLQSFQAGFRCALRSVQFDGPEPGKERS